MTSQYILTPFNLAGARLHNTSASFFALKQSNVFRPKGKFDRLTVPVRPVYRGEYFNGPARFYTVD